MSGLLKKEEGPNKIIHVSSVSFSMARNCIRGEFAAGVGGSYSYLGPIPMW